MRRKRILVCHDGTRATKTLRTMVDRYFAAANNLFVDLTLRPEPVPSEAASGEMRSHPRFRQPSALRCREATFEDVVREAWFSDLLVINNTQYHQLCDWLGNGSGISCPVLVAPVDTECLEQILLIDDASPAAHQRIKQIASLFAEFCLVTPTTLLILGEPGRSVPVRDAPVRDERRWINYLKIHFAQLAVYRVAERSAHTLPAVVDLSKNALVLCATGSLPRYINGLLASSRFEFIP